MNNKIKIMSGLVGITALALGFVGFANASTYQFIDTSGQLSNVVANSSQEALQTAYQLGSHSGVILVGNTVDVVTNSDVSNNTNIQGDGLYLYQFINTSGQLNTVAANSSQEALQTAYRLGLNSGVILVQ